MTLTVLKELQMSAAKAEMTTGQLRGAFSAPQVTAGGGVPIQAPSPVAMSSSDEELDLSIPARS